MEEVNQEQVNQEQLAALAAREVKIQEAVSGNSNEVPEGFNQDGTPIEESAEPILGKFKSQDDLIKAYQELEKKLGQSPEVKQEEAQEAPPKEVEAPSGTKVDISKFDQEFVDNGSLSEGSYKELEKIGFTKDSVDRYIRGQQALVAQYTSDIHNTVGGEESYNELVTWASANIEPAVIENYNKALATGDSSQVKPLLEYMSLKRGATPQGNRIIPSASSGEGMKAFSDKSEWQKATSHRLYGKDAKYTNMIDKRYLASKRNGSI
jgi:hypothetical protein